jgi:hypothetical protein
MSEIHLNSSLNDRERLERLYVGAFFYYNATDASREFCAFARELISDAFQGLDPETAQYHLPVDRYVEILKVLKPRFIHHPKSKQFLQRIFAERGCDPQQTYFDVPRLRSSTSDDYLTTGIAYAWHPHRDTWYSAPRNQINWWTPVFPHSEANGMTMFPEFFNADIKNNSAIYDYAEWNARHRFNASDNVKSDTRPLPGPTNDIDVDAGFPVVSEVGGLFLFAGAHLHASVPNFSGKTRFSIDFRTANLDDTREMRGAPTHDVACTNSSIGDFKRAADLADMPDNIIAAMSR